MRHGVEFWPATSRRTAASRQGTAGSAMAFPLLCRQRTVGALVGLDAAAFGHAARARSRAWRLSLRAVARAARHRAGQRAGAAEGRGAVGDRRPDAALQLALPQPGAPPGVEARLAQRAAAVAAVSRPRRVQAGQRQPRPSGGQQGARRGGGDHPRQRPRNRHRRPGSAATSSPSSCPTPAREGAARWPSASAIASARPGFWPPTDSPST